MIPADVYKAFMKAGTHWADTHGAADLLEGSLKSLKAQLALEAKSVEGCSMAEANEIALASNTYREAMGSAIKARTVANKARVGYDSVKALWEAQRTAEASERAATRAAT
jgi:hypothetical protein